MNNYRKECGFWEDRKASHKNHTKNLSHACLVEICSETGNTAVAMPEVYRKLENMKAALVTTLAIIG